MPLQPFQPRPYNPAAVINEIPPVVAPNDGTPWLLEIVGTGALRMEQLRAQLWDVAQQRDQFRAEKLALLEKLRDYQRRDVPWNRIDITDDGLDELPELVPPSFKDAQNGAEEAVEVEA